MHPVIPYVTAALLFGLGVYGVLRRRNAVLVLMAVELMLNAVNLLLVTADTTVRAALPQTGQIFALFVIVLAAAEAQMAEAPKPACGYILNLGHGCLPDTPVEGVRAFTDAARALGGLGIHLVKNLMDKVDYRRDGAKNVLTILKRIR